MIVSITDSEKHVLRSFYDRLRENLLLERGKNDLVENSIILTILKTQGTTRDRIIRKSKLTAIDIPVDGLSQLIEKGAVQSTGTFDSYVITAKGVWLFEQEKGILNDEKFLTFMTDTYFATENSLPKCKIDLDDKERVILLSMIAARAFSIDSMVDLKKGDATREKWKEILCSSYDLLKEMGLIKTAKKSTFSDNTGNEHVVVSLFRHNGKMPKKTKSIYRYTRNCEYYLDLYEGTFSNEKLSYLFWKVFNNSISNTSIEKIQAYCNDIASKEKIFLFEVGKHIFAKPGYDRILKDCLIDSIRSKDKWC